MELINALTGYSWARVQLQWMERTSDFPHPELHYLVFGFEELLGGTIIPALLAFLL